MVRKINEDSLLAADPCFLVADGMGGHEAGDLASRAAIAAFAESFTRTGPATIEEVSRALDAAREAVHRVAEGRERGAGCTLTGVVRIEHDGTGYWYLLNVGDSRVYLQRGGEFTQLTRDHSLQAERAEFSAERAAATPRNVITRALGSEDDRHDSWLLPITNGTRLLICSDGLTGELDDDELHRVLLGGEHADAIGDELLRRACEAGGRDNISLILVDVVSGGADVDDLPVDDIDGDDEVDEETIDVLFDTTLPVARSA